MGQAVQNDHASRLEGMRYRGRGASPDGDSTADRVRFHRRVKAGQAEYAASKDSNRSQGELLLWAAEKWPDFCENFPTIGKAIKEARRRKRQGGAVGDDGAAAADDDAAAGGVVVVVGAEGAHDAVKLYAAEDAVWIAARQAFEVLSSRENGPALAQLWLQLARVWPSLPSEHRRVECFALQSGIVASDRLDRMVDAAERELDEVGMPQEGDDDRVQLQPMLSFAALHLVLLPAFSCDTVHEFLASLSARCWRAELTTTTMPPAANWLYRSHRQLLFDSWHNADDPDTFKYVIHLLGPPANPHYGILLSDVSASLKLCFDPKKRPTKWSTQLANEQVR